MQNTQEICQKIYKPVWNMQNTDRSIFCIFVTYICTPHFADVVRTAYTWNIRGIIQVYNENRDSRWQPKA